MKKIRYKSNPFTSNLIVSSRSKKITVSNSIMGRSDDVFINQSTGEILQTNVATFKKVDDDKFTKLFAQNIALTFDLKAAGIKAFNILIWCVQNHAINKDVVQIDDITLEDFLLHHKGLKLSLATLYRGLDELISSQIIARHSKAGFYYINPSFCFNGDRIVFVNAIERKDSKNTDTEGQSELDI